MQLRVAAAVALSLMICSEAAAQLRTVPGSDMPVRKDRRVALTPAVSPECAPPAKPARKSGAPRLLGTTLAEVFDTADYRTRRSIITMVPRLASADERRELLLRGLRHSGNREAAFVAGVAAMTALQLGDEGQSILWHAMSQHLVRDERTRATVLAALQTRRSALR